jgi:hypothetical protein
MYLLFLAVKSTAKVHYLWPKNEFGFWQMEEAQNSCQTGLSSLESETPQTPDF